MAPPKCLIYRPWADRPDSSAHLAEPAAPPKPDANKLFIDLIQKLRQGKDVSLEISSRDKDGGRTHERLLVYANRMAPRAPRTWPLKTQRMKSVQSRGTQTNFSQPNMDERMHLMMRARQIALAPPVMRVPPLKQPRILPVVPASPARITDTWIANPDVLSTAMVQSNIPTNVPDPNYVYTTIDEIDLYSELEPHVVAFEFDNILGILDKN